MWPGTSPLFTRNLPAPSKSKGVKIDRLCNLVLRKQPLTGLLGLGLPDFGCSDDTVHGPPLDGALYHVFSQLARIHPKLNHPDSLLALTTLFKMDMGTPDSTSTMMTMMMTPYLHFTGGDALFFKQLTPDSKGAIAGAATVLFFLALLERYVVAKRVSMEARWRQRLKIYIIRIKMQTNCYRRAKAIANERIVLLRSSDEDQFTKSGELAIVGTIARTRIIPPFILSHDASRGAIHALQSLIHFGLMLAVM